ncbi:hypothetical protein [Jutongia hominis]|uniref:Uncharacterized protein n=1 Tax=Jutongia hominis TaxID=2763664 RepID=A0ABR7MTI4_9FIRM|nr:hypothetical protein [Jutongia hominis]MBC8556523.1 hypothetical protein [Jutongia hominis]
MDLSVNTSGTYATGSSKSALKSFAKKTDNTSNTTKAADTAAVYEKTTTEKKDSANKIYNRDAVVAQLKADQENRAASMQNLVEKLLGKQKGTFDLANSTNLAATFRQAVQFASPEDIAKAQADIAEDGYWGVNKTSDRLVSMAIALAGGDTDKADELKNAITKGFKKATAAWGEKLPQLCQDTYDAAMKKMDDWKNGVTTAKDYADYLS